MSHLAAPAHAPAGFTTWDRASWAALGKGNKPAGAALPGGSPVGPAEWEEAYVPLAHIVGLHLDSRADLRRRLAGAGLPGSAVGPFVIGLAGSVAAGKSTAAHTLAALLGARPGHPKVDVVSTDGFLLPNRLLAGRNLLMRKGFPETYDSALAATVLADLASGAPEVAIPRYSHEIYDIAGEPDRLVRPDIVILEGVNALGHGSRLAPVEVVDFCSLRIYLDADEPDLRRWFVARFVGLVEEAATDPASFFAQWTGLDAHAVEELAVGVWEHVNLVNLEEHILPTRWRADLVLHKGPDHAISWTAVRSR